MGCLAVVRALTRCVSVVLLASVPAGAQELTTYTSSLNGFSFGYPADWQTGPVTMGVTAGETIERIGVQAPDRSAIIVVTVSQLTRRVSDADIPSLKPEVDGMMRQAASALHGELIHSDLINGSAYGRRYLLVFELDYPEGRQITRSRQYSFFEADRQYTAVLEATVENQTRYAGLLEAILGSFVVQPR
jgi:hypothetical protein